MYAEPCIRPARVVVREIHLASEHAADSPCTPVAPRTLTSKPAPVVRGESPRFVARIRPKAASGANGEAWFGGDQLRAKPRVRFAYPGYGSRTNLSSRAREPARSCTHNRAADLLTPRTPNPSASEEA